MSIWSDYAVSTGSLGSLSLKTISQSVEQEVREVLERIRITDHDAIINIFAVMAKQIVDYKGIEFPMIKENDVLEETCFIAELCCSSRYHELLERFTENDAKAWILGHFKEQYKGGFTPAQIALIQTVDDKFVSTDEDRNLTFDTFVKFISAVAKKKSMDDEVFFAIAHYMAAICNMGNMSREWMISKSRILKKESGCGDFVFKKPIAEMIWSGICETYPMKNGKWAEFFDHMKKMFKTKKMTRLSIMCEQSAFQGCTAERLIHEAIIGVPDFAWDHFFVDPKSPAERSCFAEHTTWAKAYELIKKNPYARYEQTAGSAKSYANLGYLCKELIRRAAGVTSLDEYKGFDQGGMTISFKADIDDVITKFLAARTLARTQGEAARSPLGSSVETLKKLEELFK